MVHFATSQPTINFRGNGGGNGLSGSVVDFESNLSIEAQQDRELEKVQLFQRPFLTVPYLGRGSVDPILEAQIQQGECISSKPSLTRLGEKSYLPYHTTPLISGVKERIQNPSLMIEGVASEGWVRGGVPSRELTRDKEFYNSN